MAEQESEEVERTATRWPSMSATEFYGILFAFVIGFLLLALVLVYWL